MKRVMEGTMNKSKIKSNSKIIQNLKGCWSKILLVLICSGFIGKCLGYSSGQEPASDNCNFEEVKGHAIYGYNDKTLTQTTAQACSEECNAMRDACKSFDFNTVSDMCFLSSMDRNKVPDAFGAHEAVNYYEKVCDGSLDNPWEDSDVDESGKVRGQIIYEDAYCYIQYGPLGNHRGGQPFSDKDVAMHHNITKINVRYADLIDAIQIMYGSKKARRHGGAGGSELEISLDKGEYVTGIKIRIGRVGESITFITNMRAYGPYGNNRNSQEYIIDSGGKSLAYITGRSGGLIDEITFFFNC